jgi:hypothetical protein
MKGVSKYMVPLLPADREVTVKSTAAAAKAAVVGACRGGGVMLVSRFGVGVLASVVSGRLLKHPQRALAGALGADVFRQAS